jgi:probable rRNA maturation factor
MTDNSVKARVVLQLATGEADIPEEESFLRWVSLVMSDAGNTTCPSSSEITIRLVDEVESRELNARYRDKESATNVLSFPADIPAEIRNEMVENSGNQILGDLVICAPLVNREAAQQGKSNHAHWAHLVIHGVLHLLGHDHIVPDQAQVMETLEKDLLASLGIADPYLVDIINMSHKS